MKSKGHPVFPDLAALFLHNARSSLEEIKVQCRHPRSESLTAALHKLKGSCAMLGATVMVAILEEMEILADQDEGEGLALRHLALEAAFKEAEKVLAESAGPF
jgi:HPt (histidine-containing phosphotransfer) domain-containing protein